LGGYRRPAVALGQAIGRWGNFVNQEIYGKPTDLPWGVFIENPLEGYNPGYFHPLFLYESIWNFMNMILLIWLGWRYENRLLPGDIALTYLVIYPIGRFFMEFLRLDSSQVAGINANQTLMLVVALAAAVTLIIRHRRGSDVNTRAS
jgi:phosphatidylglycerol:prolipoprotein diacylglycerol transferase